LPLYPWAGSETTGPGPVSGERNSSPTPAFNQPTVLDGEKLGIEASCGEEGLWPCAGPNTAQAQNRFARIVLAAMRFLLLLTDAGADMDGLPIFLKKIFVAGAPQVNERCRARYCIFACGPALVAGQAVGRGRWLRSQTCCSTESDLATVPASASDHQGTSAKDGAGAGCSLRAGARDPDRHLRKGRDQGTFLQVIG
jgi:hypothetical protein